MRRKPSARVASEGVTHTQQAIEGELGWLFRNQPTEDYGIDAQAEVVDGEDVHGRLLALQIKSGTSWFKDTGPGGWWFRPDREHVQYWTNHSLPVVVVLYHPKTKRCYWQLVNRETLVKTLAGGWKLLVPEGQLLDVSARKPLQKVSEGDPYNYVCASCGSPSHGWSCCPAASGWWWTWRSGSTRVQDEALSHWA